MVGNLLQNIPEDMPEEIFETLIKTRAITLERIISKGHVTPEGEWYDQDQDEWLMILSGSARLSFAEGKEILLKKGDHLRIPAHKRHRVEETDNTCETIWLALHFNVSEKRV